MTKEGITFDYHNIKSATSLKEAVTGKRYPPKMTFIICSIRPEASCSPVVTKQVHFGISGADVEIRSSKNVHMSQPVSPGWCIVCNSCTYGTFHKKTASQSSSRSTVGCSVLRSVSRTVSRSVASLVIITWC